MNDDTLTTLCVQCMELRDVPPRGYCSYCGSGRALPVFQAGPRPPTLKDPRMRSRTTRPRRRRLAAPAVHQVIAPKGSLGHEDMALQMAVDKIIDTYDTLRAPYGPEPTQLEVAAEVGMSVSSLYRVLRTARQPWPPVRRPWRSALEAIGAGLEPT